MRIARIIGVIGRVLVTAGLLLLFYTAYLLWGTNVYTRNVQNDLARQVASKPIVTYQAVDPASIPPAKPAAKPNLGDALFTILIPRIGLKTVVVEGGTAEGEWREALKRGPGHFPGNPYPGEEGNVAISGHRTTFGAPFYRLDELAEGDVVAIESGPARYRYTVTEKLVTSPDATDVIENHGRNELTLTTCNPKFSAAQRLIVHARYDGPELIQTTPAAAPRPGERSASRAPEATLVPASPPAIPRDVLVLSVVAIASLLGAAALSKRLRLAAVWAAFVLVAGAGLWTAVFPQVLRLMPANY